MTMTKKDGILLVSRAMTLYLVLWVLSDLTYVPERLFSFFHYAKLPNASANEHYLRGYYFIILVSLVARIVALSILARWIHKCGPSVESLFLPAKPGLAEGPVQN
jgi:hypothetical protein